MRIHHSKNNDSFVGQDLETERRRQWLREMQTRPVQPGIRARWWDIRYATKHFFSRTIHNARAFYYQRLLGRVVVEAHCYFDEHKNLCREMRRQGWMPAMRAYFTDTLSSNSRRARKA